MIDWGMFEKRNIIKGWMRDKKLYEILSDNRNFDTAMNLFPGVQDEDFIADITDAWIDIHHYNLILSAFQQSDVYKDVFKTMELFGVPYKMAYSRGFTKRTQDLLEKLYDKGIRDIKQVYDAVYTAKWQHAFTSNVLESAKDPSFIAKLESCTEEFTGDLLACVKQMAQTRTITNELESDGWIEKN